VSLTPLKSWGWSSEKFHRDINYRYRYFVPNFSGVNDNPEINVTPLKSQTDFTSPFSSVKGKIHKKKYFNGKYPHTLQVLEAEKSWGLPRPHFRVQRSQ
jgi:hypothetical protein